MASQVLNAFVGYGVEIEYCIVGKDDLSCLPIADKILIAEAGRAGNEIKRRRLGWSNEFAMHVLEIKNLRPAAMLDDLPDAFLKEVRAVNAILHAHDARLMPSAMHPWMDPKQEMRLWPHDPERIYQTFQRIFDTKTHGWANLQSMHVNLPFANDDEFARLHAAIRLVLPIIPALAASSSITEGRRTGFADFRMEAYRRNSEPYSAIVGKVIPEPVSSRAEYQEIILAPMYRAIAQADRDGVLQHEWLNARGAIARFDRNSIEIRVIDTQECPQADLAVAAAIIATVHALYHADPTSIAAQRTMETDRLAHLLVSCIRDADNAIITDAEYLNLLGFPGKRCQARDLWRHLVAKMEACEVVRADRWMPQLTVMLEHGPLARRIERALDSDYSRIRLEAVYRELCDCLEQGVQFVPV
ncbi:carboxylate-amine ligase [Microvirga alba]|uniref:Glutamate--cysteine ligase n=1 Tax=Microvirga alba TaxID=2791025 RepID=A0A931FPA5_9HYPH|nr:glutamate-cysteine ligase family protein [Microvirga alba]MBF9232223.1 glutamate--cysteine ligase [Microvirga alba]